jgi:four helix bundle protein
MSRNHRQFNAFVEADALVLETSHVTEALPLHERYGLQAQVRRSAVSVPCNIVEGSARSSIVDYCRFLEIARSSSTETGYLLGLSSRLSFLRTSVIAPLVERYDHLQAMLFNAEQTLRDRDRGRA